MQHGCCGDESNIGESLGGALSAALLEAVSVAIDLQQIDVMGEPVEQGESDALRSPLPHPPLNHHACGVKVFLSGFVVRGACLSYFSCTYPRDIAMPKLAFFYSFFLRLVSSIRSHVTVPDCSAPTRSPSSTVDSHSQPIPSSLRAPAVQHI
jgi:hypothetical protein